jgi:hypothetical protein
MIIRRLICCVLLVSICYASFLFAREKKLEKLRVGGGSASATQMSLWLAKEANPNPTIILPIQAAILSF